MMAIACGSFRVRLAAVGVAALLLLIAILVAGSGATVESAHAQSPAGIDQYLPGNDGGGGGGGPTGGGGGPVADPAGVPGGGGPSADAGRGGELPFTGYPLTPLLLILLFLLAAGLTLRVYLTIRDRARNRTLPARG